MIRDIVAVFLFHLSLEHAH